MKRCFFLISFMVLSSFILGQSSYLEAIQQGDAAFKKGEYKTAVNKYFAAEAFDPTKKEVVKIKVNQVFDKVESLKNEAQKEKIKAEENIQKLANLIGDITDILQRDENASIIGLDPLQNDLFQIILPYNDFLRDKSKIDDSGRNAKAYYQIAVSLERMGKSGFFKMYEESYTSAVESITSLETKKRPIPNKLMITFLTSTYNYSWLLMTAGRSTEAKEILLHCVDIAKNTTNSEPQFLDALSGIENALSRLTKEMGDEIASLSHQIRAVELIKIAIEKNPKNLTYKAALSVYLDNLTITPDSLLSEAEKQKYKEAGCELAYSIQETPGAGAIGFLRVISCMHNKTFDLTSQSKYQESIELLNEANDRLTKFIHLDPANPSYYLHRARIKIRLSDIENNLQNNDEQVEYLISAKEDFVRVFRNGSILPTELWLVRNVYDRIRIVPTLLNKPEVQMAFLRDIDFAFNSSADVYGDVKEIGLIAADNYMQMGEFSRKADYGYDSTQLYLTKAIEFFHKSKLLNDISSFSEKYEWFCRAYSQRLQLNYDYKKLEPALSDLKTIDKLFTPILDKYPFDFYLRQHFWGSYMRVGDLLVQHGRLAEAKPILEYASNWGMDTSTRLLAQLYKEGKFGAPNISIADSLENLASKQSMKKFTIPCDFGNIKAPFDVYVKEYPRDFPYKGIDDQAHWLAEARGGVVPEVVRESFIKLQVLAWKNNISYPDLCVYALESANEEKKDASQIEHEIFNDLKDFLNNGKKIGNIDQLTNHFSFEQAKLAIIHITSLLDKAQANDYEKIARYDECLQSLKKQIISNTANDRIDIVEILFKIANSYKNKTEYLNQFLDSLEIAEKSFILYSTIFDVSMGDSSTLKQIASENGSYAFLLIEQKKYKLALQTVQLALKSDNEDMWAKSNLPLAYLLNDDFKSAKRYYMLFKKQPFNDRYPTFKDAFLDDIRSLKIRGIKHPDFEKIENLLNHY